MFGNCEIQCIQRSERLGTDPVFRAKDLGEQIRKQAKRFTDLTGASSETSGELTKQIEALERLANNTYGKKYTRVLKSTATGLTAEQCNQVLSSEFLQYLNDDKNKKKF